MSLSLCIRVIIRYGTFLFPVITFPLSICLAFVLAVLYKVLKVVCSSLTPFFIVLWYDGYGNHTAQVCTEVLLAAMLMRGRRREMGSNTEATTIGHRWGWNCCVLFNWALMSFSRVAVSRTMVSRTGGGACSVSNMHLFFGGNLWCQCWGRSVESFVLMLHAYLFVKTHYRLRYSSPVSRLQWQRLWVPGICALRLAVSHMNCWKPCMYTESCFNCEYESCSGSLCTAVRCSRCHIVNSC